MSNQPPRGPGQWPMRRARQQGNQGVRPGNAIEGMHGPQFAMLQPDLQRALRYPLNPSIPQEEAQQQLNIPINWISQTFNSTAVENIVNALPNRVILIIQNLSPTTPIAVNFDQTASVSGTSPNYVAQGILLLPGVSLFIARWCPTGTVHIAASASPTVCVQGYSSVGNMPGLTGE